MLRQIRHLVRSATLIVSAPLSQLGSDDRPGPATLALHGFHSCIAGCYSGAARLHPAAPEVLRHRRRPMIEWVWRAAMASGRWTRWSLPPIRKKSRPLCRERGIPVVMTSADCASGSDRVREVAAQLDADIYVNIQGDEPTLTGDFFPPLLALFDRPEVRSPRLRFRARRGYRQSECR